jgi:hypothetical protein
VVVDGPLDALTDPPGGVGRELVTLPPVEAVDGPHEPEDPFLDEVRQRQARLLVPLGDPHDEAQVGGDHLLAGRFVARLHPLCQLHLFLGGEEGVAAHFLEHEVHGCLLATRRGPTLR